MNLLTTDYGAIDRLSGIANPPVDITLVMLIGLIYCQKRVS